MFDDPDLVSAEELSRDNEGAERVAGGAACVADYVSGAKRETLPSEKRLERQREYWLDAVLIFIVFLLFAKYIGKGKVVEQRREKKG